jgi:hypothetical protein
MNDIENERLVQLAALQRKIDHGESAILTMEMDHFQRMLAEFTVHDLIVMSLAVMLLEGKTYRVTADSPETVRRCKSLADHMGASLEEIRESAHLTQIIFRPASPITTISYIR